MRIRPRLTRVRRSLRTARMALRRRGVILLYHRVASPRIDPLLLCVSPAHFEEHLDILRHTCTPLSLAELVEASAAGTVPDRAAAVTFDDGYADNGRAAAPILRRHGMRATVFVAGDCLEGRPFYYDELEEILLTAPRLPGRLRILVRGRKHEWEFGEWARLPKNPGRDYWRWNMDSASDPTPRHRCYRELFCLLREENVDTRRQTIAALRRAARAGPWKGGRLWMTEAEMRKAARGGTLEFGAHTRSHPALNRITPRKQRLEIVSGKRMLEAVTGAPARAFAYPYGSPWDVTPESVQLAREAGFSFACANWAGPVDSESDPFWLPRCLVRDWSGEEFDRRLRRFFEPRAEILPQG